MTRLAGVKNAIAIFTERIGEIKTRAVDAKELYESVRAKGKFYGWFYRVTKAAGLKEGVDFIIDKFFMFGSKTFRGTRYVISVSAAKRIVRRMRKGERVVAVREKDRVLLVSVRFPTKQEIADKKASKARRITGETKADVKEQASNNVRQDSITSIISGSEGDVLSRLSNVSVRVRGYESEGFNGGSSLESGADAYEGFASFNGDKEADRASSNDNEALKRRAIVNQTIPFSFEGNSLRTLSDETGAIWFCAKDAATMLGYSNTNDAIARHCKGVKDGVVKRYPIVDSLGRTQEATFISEGDLYRLIANSHMPFAQKFERWIFEEVLPSIRKTGDYKLPQSSASSLKLTINNVEVELIAKEDQVWATSLDIAKAFEKRHDNVIRDIRALPEDSFYLLNFGEVEYQHINPRSGGIVKYPMFRVSKDGFMMLAMGFTGQGSHQWKIAFIEGFNRLERMVKESRWVKADWKENQEGRSGVCKNLSPQDLSLIAIQKLITETLASQAKIAALETRQTELDEKIMALETKSDNDNNGYITPFEQKMLRQAAHRRACEIKKSLQNRYGKETVDSRALYTAIWKKINERFGLLHSGYLRGSEFNKALTFINTIELEVDETKRTQ